VVTARLAAFNEVNYSHAEAKGNEMTDCNEENWIYRIDCPFCKTEIVRAIDFSMFPANMPEEERDEWMMAGDDTGSCEHLAFWSDYAYDGPRIEKSWKHQVDLVAKALWRRDQLDSGEGKEANIDSVEELSMALSHVFHGCGHLDELVAVMDPALEGVEVEVDGGYVEQYSGPRSGGPTYMLVFMRYAE